jgi:predicted dehydrogenase
MKTDNDAKRIGRRAFLAAAGASGIFTIVKPSAVRGSAANSAISLGLIGCGGRGTWIARHFSDSGNYRLTACADYFGDRVESCGQRFEIPAERRYTTLSGYKRLLESDVDAVAIESPPYFHPEHAAASVEAGKHVYTAKPIAVDVPGCLSIGESGRRATERKQVFLVDFQTRANDLYQEAVKRVHQGDIGKIVCAEAQYPWAGGGSGTTSDDPEAKLRNWYTTLAYSGDVIVEQDIHALDVATWFLDAAPEKAYGTGGRGQRKLGNIWDHFSVIYWFPGDVVLTFSSVKMIPHMPDAIHCRVFGSGGVADSDYFSNVWIKGNKPYEGGSVGNLYTTGTVNNIETFHRLVTEGDYANDTVEPSVRSNLTSVLGRTAAYAGEEVTMRDIMTRNEKLEPPMDGLKG